MIEQHAADPTGRLGQYELLDRLSDSHFGARWRVRGASDVPRALRMIATEAPERFAMAAAAVRGVKHPSLLAPIELVRPGRGLAIVTEDVPGETLHSLLDRAVRHGESIPESIALRSVLDLLEALQALEQAEGGAPVGPHLHGGLTLDAIHVGADGRTRLLDPGVVAMVAREPRFARNPALAAYTAPEHADGSARFDARSDVFSLGVVLWELVACRSLFWAPTYDAVIERVLHEPIPRIQRERFLRGEPVSAALAVLVGRALQRDPEKRFQSYAELSEALQDVGRVADRDEVAAFVEGGMRSLLTSGIVSSLPAPALPVERPRLLEPPPASVYPQPAPAYEELSPVDADPMPVDADPMPVDADPMPLYAQATTLYPEPTTLYPEPTPGNEADPPPAISSARPIAERPRARLEVLVGTLVLVIGAAVVYSLWTRGADGPPTNARPSIPMPIAKPRPHVAPAVPTSPRAASAAFTAPAAPAAPARAASVPPMSAPHGSAAITEPTAPAPAATGAPPRPKRAPGARAKRAAQPAAAPAVYIPDDI
jgi:serine/threonine protein kinase